MLWNGAPRVCAFKCLCILICQTALLTKGDAFIFLHSRHSSQQQSEQKERCRCLNVYSRCCVFEGVCADVRVFERRFQGGSVEAQASKNSATPQEKVLYPLTAAARSIIATGFLTAAEGEDQSDLDSSRRKHEKEVPGNE